LLHENKTLTFWTVNHKYVDRGLLCLILGFIEEEFEFTSRIEVGKSVQVFESQTYFEAYLPVIKTLSQLTAIPFEVRNRVLCGKRKKFLKKIEKAEKSWKKVGKSLKQG
jgi:hypothetical protein